MADNQLVITAGLDIPKTVSTIKKDLKQVSDQLDKDYALKIVGNIDLGKTTQRIQSQITTISKNLSLSIPKIDLQTSGDETVQKFLHGITQEAEKAGDTIEQVDKSLKNLANKYTKGFKIINFEKGDNKGYTNAAANIEYLRNQLKELGTVNIEAIYNDAAGSDSAKGTGKALNSLIATVKNAQGEIRTLRFEINSTGDAFEYVSGKFSDKSVGKIQQDIVRLEKELANFKASHQAIETGLTQPLTAATNAIDDLKSGIGSVESAQKALDNLKTVAANIGSNLKSAGSSFNIFDNATNKAQNFDNTIKELGIDIGKLQFTDKKSGLVESLDLAKQKLEEFRRVESESGKGLEWSQRYAEINSLLQSVTNNLKAAKKEESEIDAFNRKLDAHNQEIQKKLDLKEQEIQKAKELNEVEMQNYWQGRFEESVKGMTAENQVLKDMKKYYEDLNKEAIKAENQQAKDENRIANLQNRISKLTAEVNRYATANQHATTSMEQMSNGKTFAVEWSRITTEMAKGADLTDRELKDLSADMAVFKKEAQAAGLAGESAFGKFLNSFKTMSSYITANMVFNFVKRQVRELVNEVTEVDTAMTELRKVTEATNEQFEAFAISAGKTGRELGASVSDVINATATFARLGESLPDAEELGKVATLYKNVGDGISIETASEDIVSTMKAFKIEAKDAITIVDKLNEVETCPFYILVERNRRHIFPNCWEILKSFSLLFSKRRKPETSKRIAYGEKKHIQSAKVVCVLSVV